MRKFTLAAMAAVILSATACAQQAPWAGPRGPGQGGPGMGPRFGSDYTPGWSMMDPAEREEHQRAMQGARTPEECRRLRDEHLQRMQQRGMARGMAGIPMPRFDACAGMQP